MTSFPLQITRVRAETWIEYAESHCELASTNDHALTMALDPALPCPALIVADRQTAGRGRGGHVWQSGPGALTISLILDCPASLPRQRLPLVSLVAGLATRAAIAGAVPDSLVHVKWPNDVYLAGRKAAGILTETASAAPSRVIVGIGINVNNSLAQAPLDVRQRGIALADHIGRRLDPTDLLIALLIDLEMEFSRLVAGGAIDLARWRPHCLLTGRQIAIRVGSTILQGRCRGIDSDGGLRIDSNDGPRTVHAGEVIGW